MLNKHRIIVIAPAYNEANKIGNVVRKIPFDIVDEMVVIDDGSHDNTYKKACDAGATIIRHPKNKGVGAAIRSGIDYAIEKKFDIIVVISGDDQHVPSEIASVIRPIAFEQYDFVQGSRRLDGKRYKNITLFRRITTRVFAIIFRCATFFPATDATNGFRAFKTTIFKNKAINIWQDWLDTYELEPYLYYKVVTHRPRFKIKEVPVTIIYHPKIVGWTKMKPVIDWWRIIKPLIVLRLGLKK